MEIDDKLVQQLLQKEVEKQVREKLQSMIKKTINSMIKDVIKSEVRTAITNNTELIQQEIKKQLSTENYGNIIANNIAEKIKGDIINALTNPDNDNFDRYYDN